jgi:hypothetical protein
VARSTPNLLAACREPIRGAFFCMCTKIRT